MLPPDLTLFHAAKSSAEVIRRALDHIGAAYELASVNTAAGEQRSAAYLAINPRGRVPALRLGETVLTEVPAILLFLHGAAPEAGLLPPSGGPAQDAQRLAELLWCSATLHPAVRHLRAPAKFTQGDAGPVTGKALQTLAELADYAEARLGSGHWLEGRWSILDTYVAWGFAAAAIGGFDLAPYPALTRLIDRDKPFRE